MKIKLIFIGMVTGILLIFGFLWIGSITNAFADREILLAAAPHTSSSSEGAAGWKILPSAGDDESPPAGSKLEILAPNVLPTPIPGQTLVYFLTADSDATATVLVLLNTSSVSQTVALRGYSYAGALGYSINIVVPATGIIRLVSDSLVASPPPSWSTPAPIITNFTDFTYYASLSLPIGVKVEGYTLFNPVTGTIDPRLDQGAIPIRFSTDPASVFLPALQNK